MEKRIFAEGKTVGTQRIRIEVEPYEAGTAPDMKPIYRQFVTIYQSQGDDTVTEMLFTQAEWHFVAEELTRLKAIAQEEK